MKKLILAAILTLPGIVSAQGALGEIIGTVVTDDEMTLSNVIVQTESNGVIYKDLTDSKGRFRISAIPAGNYNFMIINDIDTMKNIHGEITMDGIENLETIVFIPNATEILPVFTLKSGKDEIHLIRYGVNPVIKMTALEIKRSPLKFDQTAMIAAMSSDIKVSDDGQLIFRGARKGDMIYMMDGVKMGSVSNVPSSSIGNMMVYTGGIPAKYGDTTGGVVVMETKSYFDLYREWKNVQD